LAFINQPSPAALAGVVFNVQPRVAIRDAGGNTVTTDLTGVTLTLAPTAGGAALTCAANPQAPDAGVASFSLCSINNAGTYTLTASAGAYTVAVSNSVVVT
jgi:hypothetical protein